MEAANDRDEMRAQIEERVATVYRNGVWMDAPWFCVAENDWLDEAGYPLAERKRLVEPLKKLYPARVCRRLLLTQGEGTLVVGLFEQMPGFLIPALRVARSLSSVPSAAKTRILEDLRRWGTFSSAATELRIWADLVQAGFRVDREPPVLTKTSVARPDFGVAVGADYYVIEVTELQQSAQERVARLVEDEVFAPARSVMLDGRSVRLLPGPDFLKGLLPQLASMMSTDSSEARDAVRAMLRQRVLPAVREAHAEANATGGKVGTYAAPGVGSMEVSVCHGTEAACALVPDPEPEEVARRVVAKIIEKARQLQEGRRRVRRGIVVINVGQAASIVAIVQKVVALLKAGPAIRHADRLERVDSLVLRGSWQHPGGVWKSAAHPITLRDKPTRDEVALFYALGGGFLVSHTRGRTSLVGRDGQRFSFEK